MFLRDVFSKTSTTCFCFVWDGIILVVKIIDFLIEMVGFYVQW